MPNITDAPTAVYVALRNTKALAEIASALADDLNIATEVGDEIATAITCLDDALSSLENNEDLLCEEFAVVNGG